MPSTILQRGHNRDVRSFLKLNCPAQNNLPIKLKQSRKRHTLKTVLKFK